MDEATKKRSVERKARAEALHASIIDQVQQLADSGQWRKFLDFARSFHSYSLNNVLLVLAQNPDTTIVAGFRQWQTKGRQVHKGETSIRDLPPEQAAKTLIHEAAHIHLGHVDDLDGYRQHRGRMEAEAESVAYIVAGLSGFDTSAYSIGYTTGRADGNVELIRETAARVLTAAHAIARVTT